MCTSNSSDHHETTTAHANGRSSLPRSTSSSSSAPQSGPLHQAQALQALEALAKRPVEMSTLTRFQREAYLPIELEVAFVPNLMRLLRAFNEASDHDVASLLQRGMGITAGETISEPLARALTAATDRIRTYQGSTQS